MNRESGIAIVLLFLLVFLSASVLSITVAQARQYHLDQEWVKIWINQDGSIDLFYNISITLDSGDNINFIKVAQPQGDFTIGNATDQYGDLLSTSDASSESDYKVQVNLASPLTAGKTIWFTLITNVAGMIYKDNETNVGMLFKPTWWSEATVSDLRVSIVLPLGVASSQIGTSVNWDNLLIEPDGRLAVFWERHNLAALQQYDFGVSFPKEYVQVYVEAGRVHNLNTGLNYTTIQEAINANETLDGHTICVDAGIYHEALRVNKSLSLTGANRNATIIDGNFSLATLVTITANNTTISNVTIRNSYYGIEWQYNLSNVVISKNVITNISGVGIYAGSNGRIVDNIMEDNWCCISSYGGNNNTIVGNTLVHSSNVALSFGYAGFDEPNIVWSNNVINNNRSIYNYESVTELNSDYPIGGNYWSEYEGIDKYSGPYQNESGSDGIGDTPYIVDQYTVDHYPLMGAFYGPWKAETGELNVISNSTVSDFWLTYDILWGAGTFLHDVSFDVSGDTGTNGFCRVHIPFDLFNGTYRVLVNGAEVPYALLPCSNSTDSYLYFTYTHSTKKVEITPEFPSFLVLPLFMIATLLVMLVYKGKHLT